MEWRQICNFITLPGLTFSKILLKSYSGINDFVFNMQTKAMIICTLKSLYIQEVRLLVIVLHKNTKGEGNKL